MRARGSATFGFLETLISNNEVNGLLALCFNVSGQCLPASTKVQAAAR